MSISISGSGGITGATTSYSFDQSVSIGGTLTYEDVTNIDSVGVITARQGLDTPTNLVLRTGGTERVRIDSSGNVGIGISTPLALLDVALLASGSRRLLVNYTNSTITLQGANSSSTNENLRLAGDKLIFASGSGTGAEQMRIDSSGNLGIGTDNPQGNLEVHSGSATNIIAKSTNGNGGFLNYSGLASNGTTTFSVNHNGTIYTAGGLNFGSVTSPVTSQTLDDYEEGTFNMTLSVGGSTDTETCRYTKVGRVVYIEGHGNDITDNFFNTGSNGTDTSVTITSTLPFTPAATGAIPITVTRTLKGASGFSYERMFIGWRKDSTTLYLSSVSNHYYPQNNVVTLNNQTNKTLLFSGSYFV